jgi:hypothetical protein
VYASVLSPYVLHALPITVFLILSPEKYVVRSTEHKALCYVDFSTPLLPHPSWAQISSSALYINRIYVWLFWVLLIQFCISVLEFGRGFIVQHLVPRCWSNGRGLGRHVSLSAAFPFPLLCSAVRGLVRCCINL